MTTYTVGQALEAAAAAAAGATDDLYIRFDECEYAAGDALPCSRVWIDGDPTDEYLPGTSALRLDYTYAQRTRDYLRYFGHVYLVCGDGGLYGEDVGEAIVRHATVVCKLLTMVQG